MFSGCTSLTTAFVNAPSATSCGSMFSGCTSLTTIPKLPESATNCSYMLNGCTALVNCDVTLPNATNCSYMLNGCTALVNCDVTLPNATDCSYMLNGCTNLKLARVSSSATSVNINRLFTGCISIESIEIITPNVTNFGTLMFNNTNINNLKYMNIDCGQAQLGYTIFDAISSNIETLILRCALDISTNVGYTLHATNFIWYSTNSNDRYFFATLFKDCTNITIYDSPLTTYKCVFKANTTVESIEIHTVSGVTSFEDMCYGCTNLKSLYIDDSSSVTNALSAFANCSSLQEIPVLNTSSLTNAGAMFYGCSNVKYGMYGAYKQMESTVTNKSNCFTNCGTNTVGGTAERALIPTSWGGAAT